MHRSQIAINKQDTVYFDTKQEARGFLAGLSQLVPLGTSLTYELNPLTQYGQSRFVVSFELTPDAMNVPSL